MAVYTDLLYITIRMRAKTVRVATPRSKFDSYQQETVGRLSEEEEHGPQKPRVSYLLSALSRVIDVNEFKLEVRAKAEKPPPKTHDNR